MTPSRFTVDPHILDNSDLSKVEVLRHWQHQISVLLEQLQKAIIFLPPTPSSSVYLNGAGQWSTPLAGGGGGDMTKAVYDTNNNGVVDTADSLAWSKLTGVPASFTPSTHAPTHLDNGSDPVPVVTTLRTGSCPKLSGTATTFLNGSGAFSTPTGVTPSAHASTHITGGSDVIPVPTTSATGLVPVLPATVATSKFLRGDATFSQPDYSNLTGVPTSFAPTAHAATHLDNGSDPIAVVTSTRTGLAPKLSGTTTTFLNGTGVFSTPTGVTPSAHASTHITGGSDVIPAPTTSASGLVPVLPGNTTTFLRGDGTFATPSVAAPPSSLTDLGSPAGNSTINTAQAFLIAVNLKWTTAANWTLTLQNVILGSVLYLRLLNNSGAARTFTITATNPSAAAYTVTVYVPGGNPLSGAITVNNGNALNLNGISYTVAGSPTIQLFGFGSTG